MPTRLAVRGTQRNSLCKKKRGAAHSGWYVSFADLMALMVSFFVMLVASTQDSEKAQSRRT